jgi:hypothetical protein
MTPAERIAAAHLKVALCEAMIRFNAEGDPYPPIIPPTAIDWIGDALVAAVLPLFTKETP